MSNKKNKQIGIGHTNIQIETFEEDLGTIGKIYKKVLEKSKNKISTTNDYDFLEINKKIEFNISDPEEQERIKELFKSIYDKISLIEKTFSNLDISQQREITIIITDQYHQFLKKNNSEVSQTLDQLFSHYTPKTKSINPKYNLLARAFVLFFFDDCTIGRKTNDNPN